MKKIILEKGKEKSVHRFHPWVFSGAVSKKEGNLSEGDIVEVYDWNNHYLATGHYHNSSICVRIFSFSQVEPDELFWRSKIENAIRYRKALSLLNNENTTIFRLVNGEGDNLPGLVIDWFNGHVVIQFHSYGMFLLKDLLIKTVLDLFPGTVHSIYSKSASTLSETRAFIPSDELLYGSFDDVIVKENGISFYIDIIKGQKTGFFIDQRENRNLVRELANAKNVLNLFGYTGGFSAYALTGNADLVHTVDISKKAIELTERNIALLGELSNRHRSYTENVFDFLENIEAGFYDLIVLDPPAFAKHHKIKEQGVKGYRNVNRKAMEKIRDGGFLFTFSCSQAISKEDFQTIVFSAAAMENKKIRIVKQLHHASDHPVNIFHPEGDYLKGLLLYVEN